MKDINLELITKHESITSIQQKINELQQAINELKMDIKIKETPTLEDILEERVVSTIDVLYELEGGLCEYKSMLSQLLQDFEKYAMLKDYYIEEEIYDLVDGIVNNVANIAYKNELNADNNIVNDVFYRLFLIKQILQRCTVMESMD